jgi:hypothetical protein
VSGHRATSTDVCRIEAIRKSGGRLTELGIPEMLDYLKRIGYKVGRVLAD